MVNTLLQYRAASMHVGFTCVQQMIEELGLNPGDEESLLELNREVATQYRDVKRQLMAQYVAASQQQQLVAGPAYLSQQYPLPQLPAASAIAPTLPSTMSPMMYYNTYSNRTPAAATEQQQPPSAPIDMSAVYAEHAARGDGWNRPVATEGGRKGRGESGGRRGDRHSSASSTAGSIALDPYEGQYDEKGFPLHATVGDRVDRVSLSSAGTPFASPPLTQGSPRCVSAKKEGYVPQYNSQRSTSHETREHGVDKTSKKQPRK